LAFINFSVSPNVIVNWLNIFRFIFGGPGLKSGPGHGYSDRAFVYFGPSMLLMRQKLKSGIEPFLSYPAI
jgi:hypothetical protein